MRIQLIFLSMSIYAAGLMQPLRAQEPKTADEVVARVLAQDGIRESASGGYTGAREYVLENHLFQKRARMLVRVNCDRNGMKHFQVMSEDGWRIANERVLREMLAAESTNSHPETRPTSRITSDNYRFRMIDSGSLDGRASYVIEIIPKRQEKSLFRGRIWVDAEDYAIARVEGEPAKSPSFWIGKVHFVQQYQKKGPFWFPAMTTSVTDARMFGATDVNIRYFDYKPVSAAPTGFQNFAFMEAHNDKR
jgi:hypothetical protein